MVLQNKHDCTDMDFWSFFFLSALDSAALSFLSSSKSLAILFDKYSPTTFQPPGDVSAILIILFLVSITENAFFNVFQCFLVKLFLIRQVVDSSCAMM